MSTIGTAALAAKIALVLNMQPAPTVTVFSEPEAQRPFATNMISSRSLFLPEVSQLTTVVANEDRFDVAFRSMTSLENLAGEIRQFKSYEDNWDGEGAAKPNAQSISDVVSFIGLLDDRKVVPESMLLSSGNVALYWNEGGVYADIEFLGDDRIAYFIKNNGDKHKGVLSFDSKTMPSVFTALITV